LAVVVLEHKQILQVQHVLEEQVGLVKAVLVAQDQLGQTPMAVAAAAVDFMQLEEMLLVLMGDQVAKVEAAVVVLEEMEQQLVMVDLEAMV
jgi:UTP-glucose-1-phosphate uridylyltransferase